MLEEQLGNFVRHDKLVVLLELNRPRGRHSSLQRAAALVHISGGTAQCCSSNLFAMEVIHYGLQYNESIVLDDYFSRYRMGIH